MSLLTELTAQARVAPHPCPSADAGVQHPRAPRRLSPRQFTTRRRGGCSAGPFDPSTTCAPKTNEDDDDEKREGWCDGPRARRLKDGVAAEGRSGAAPPLGDRRRREEAPRKARWVVGFFGLTSGPRFGALLIFSRPGSSVAVAKSGDCRRAAKSAVEIRDLGMQPAICVGAKTLDRSLLGFGGISGWGDSVHFVLRGFGESASSRAAFVDVEEKRRCGGRRLDVRNNSNR